MLFDLADGLRVGAVALAAYLPETAPKILAALGQPQDLGWEQVEYGRLQPADRNRGGAAALPAHRARADADAA